jgi:DNA-binding NarL/FixJ family response regulator
MLEAGTMHHGEIKIIVVEDHNLFRIVIKKIVETIENCHVVAEARCGMEALELIKTTPADLIVMDLRLPGINGVSLIEESKKIGPTKILVLTASREKDIIQSALDAGADGICSKDNDKSVFEKAIVETLAGSKPIYLERPQSDT